MAEEGTRRLQLAHLPIMYVFLGVGHSKIVSSLLKLPVKNSFSADSTPKHVLSLLNQFAKHIFPSSANSPNIAFSAQPA